MGTKYNDTFMIKSITLYDSLKKNKKKQFLEALYEKKAVMAIKLLEKKIVRSLYHYLPINSPLNHLLSNVVLCPISEMKRPYRSGKLSYTAQNTLGLLRTLEACDKHYPQN